MNKEYKLTTFHRSAKPRSKRLQGMGSGSTGSTIVNITQGGATPMPDPNSHTHANKSVLDSLDTEEGYLLITRQTADGSVVRERVRSGIADEAKHSQTSKDLDPNSPVYKKMLRKDIADTASGLLTLEQGANFGHYIPGPAGTGAKVDGKGNAEFDSLLVRHFLDVPEMRYNRISVEVGNKWNAPGGGLIERVVRETETTGTIYLKLQEGERGAVEVDDICQGIFHDAVTKGNNERSDSDDGIGNFSFRGFYTCYFKVTEIVDSINHSEFKYELRTPSKSWPRHYHPAASMNFVAYGNFTNKSRQTSRYSTRTYERYLIGVNDWEFTVKMIAAQFGDLSNLAVFGLEMSGYSAYLDRIYMSGTIQQFENRGYTCETLVSCGEYIGDSETASVQISIKDGYGRDVTEDFRIVSVLRNGNNNREDKLWGQDILSRYANNIPNPFTLTAEDLGTYESTSFQIIAVDLNTFNLLST